MNAELSAEAQADVLRIDAWWRANRPYAPNLFSEEVIDLLEQLATAPECGENYKNIEGGAVRRTLLPKTRHYAYTTSMANPLWCLLRISRSRERLDRHDLNGRIAST